MLFALVIAFLAVGTHAGITDKNCTTADGKWSERALGCKNSVSDTVCTSIVNPQTPLSVGTDTDRASNCYQMNSADSEEKKQAMINMCPNTCGYCCLTPQYNCANRECKASFLLEVPGVTCDSITQAQCNDAKWREIIARDCPNVCGFCLEGGCVDAAIECANDKSICRNVDMQAFVQVNCKKTCGYCTGSSSTQYPGGITFAPGTCRDNSKSCASWKVNGFCESTFYNAAQKAQNCAKTCGLC
ncbi:shTK domain protein [Ancylostoma ceylanicum]|uniref:ShTK domain protein n=1 Tax=Ancylostoma ceylanicum TaxID=53326 RepID=A0A0D6M8Y7_9BILA|nr:shTK domain protein [Ancylostoma ceylanicum]